MSAYPSRDDSCNRNSLRIHILKYEMQLQTENREIYAENPEMQAAREADGQVRLG